MKENKLGVYLSSFTANDWSQYHKFSKSLYNESSDYQHVINYIKKHKSQFDPSYMDAEYLRKKIRPAASKAVFSKVISNLCKHIEEYFTWAEIENDSMMKDTLLLQALGKRGLKNHFQKFKEKTDSKRKDLPLGLWNDYFDFKSNYLMYYCDISSDIKMSREALEDTNSHLIAFFRNMGSYLGVEMHNRTIVLNENWNKTIQSLKINTTPTAELRNVFLHLIKLKENRDAKSFEILKTKLPDKKLSRELRHMVLIHLTSFINRQKVRGKIKDGKEILKLYQFGLENKLLFPNNLIPLIRYINIIGVACNVKEYDWASGFVDKYSKFVVYQNIPETKILGLTQIEFSKGNFENVVNLLRNVKYKNIEIESRARWFLLCSNYELNKYDHSVMEYYIQSFSNFLRRNKFKITKLKSDGLSNSVKYLNSISRGYNLTNILENMKKDKSLYTRSWLMSKISEKLD